MSKTKILFLAANPIEENILSLDEEIRAITQNIRRSDYRDSIDLRSAWAVRSADFVEYLNEYKPQVVHFSGHGDSGGAIMLAGDDGDPKPVSAADLRKLFRVLKDKVQLVVLNACYTEDAATAITDSIDCAIGMNTTVMDASAIAFAAQFYSAIGFGRSIKQAFDQAVLLLELDNLPGEKTPQLKVRPGVDADQIILVSQPGPVMPGEVPPSSPVSMGPPPAAGAVRAHVTDPTGRSFISYSRSRSEEVALLVAALHDRGVPTWQDVSQLGAGQTEGQLRKTLEEPSVSSGILWLTSDVGESDMIKKVEMPLIVDRAVRDENFFAMVVAAGGLDYKTAGDLAQGFVAYDLSGFNMFRVTTDPINPTEAASIARLALHYRIERIVRRLPPAAPLSITINSGTAAEFEVGNALIVDWSKRFANGRTVLHGAWEDFILPAIKDVVEAVKTRAPHREVEATGLLSIPAAVALGCGFLEPLAIKISWRPRQTPDQLWNIKALPQPSGFASNILDDTVSADDLAVLVSVDNDVKPGFTRSKRHLPKFRAIAEIKKPGNEHGSTRHEIHTPGPAKDIAYVVRRAIISARNRHPEIRRTHLFMSVPAGLAMMIGQLMNTCGPIQTYEFSPDNHECPYQPSVLLNPTW